MPNSNSLEQNIYRNLAAQIQSGFYSKGNRFPPAQEIARLFNVSYGPAQRALKALEKDGLIKVGRGKETLVLKKPYENYLESDTFKKRILSLIDLSHSLRLFSPAINLQGMYHMDLEKELENPLPENNRIEQWRTQYRLFDNSLSALGNQTLHGLYHDINAFVESAFLDIFHVSFTEEEEKTYLNRLVNDYRTCLENCKNGKMAEAKKGLEALTDPFHITAEQYLATLPADRTIQENFSWSPQKGRTRYCDMIAIDLVRKINDGTHPAGTLLPNGAILANIYHVSPITIRRTITLLNKLGVAKTVNGVGTRVVSTENTHLSVSLKAMILGNNLRTFLEAYQLFAMTSEPFISHTFPHFPEELTDKLRQATTIAEPNIAISAITASSLQGIVRYCPLASIREIYSKLTLLLLNGSAIPHAKLTIDWNRGSKELAEALDAKNGHLFACLFSRILNEIFATMKTHLKKMGVKNIDQIAQPVMDDR